MDIFIEDVCFVEFDRENVRARTVEVSFLNEIGEFHR